MNLINRENTTNGIYIVIVLEREEIKQNKYIVQNEEISI